MMSLTRLGTISLILFSQNIWADSVLPKGALAPQEKTQYETILKLNPSNHVARVKLAKHHLKTDNYDKVIELIEPFNAEVSDKGLMILAKAYGKKKDYENQIRVLEIVIQRDPKKYQAHYYLGHAFSQQGDDVKAIKSFRKVIELKPNFKIAYEQMLKLFKKVNNRYESRSLVMTMIKRFGEQPKYFVELCRLYSEEGFLEESIQNCKKAISMAPNFPDNHVYLANSYRDKGEFKLAEEILNRSSRSFPNSEFVQWAAGDFHFKNRNYTAAQKHFMQATKSDDKSARSQLGLALSSFEIKKYDMALNSFVNACKLDSKNISHFRSASAKLRVQGLSKLNKKFDKKLFACR